jgi:hypothetical protein
MKINFKIIVYSIAVVGVHFENLQAAELNSSLDEEAVVDNVYYACSPLVLKQQLSDCGTAFRDSRAPVDEEYQREKTELFNRCDLNGDGRIEIGSEGDCYFESEQDLHDSWFDQIGDLLNQRRECEAQARSRCRLGSTTGELGGE